MPLDPYVVDLLARARSLGRPPLRRLTPAEARAFVEADTAAKPRGPDLPAVDEVQVPGPAGALKLRIYRPATGVLPAVLYLHGGGFVFCDLDSHDGICRLLAARSGRTVVSVDYRLAPEHPFPAAADDCLAVLRLLAEQGNAFAIDPARIVVAGDSAGGNLAAVTALRARDEGGPPIEGQILAYPVTASSDAGLLSYSTFAEGFGLTASDMAWFWDHYADARGRVHPHAAPILAESLAGLPPAFVFTAAYDVLRDEGEAYARRLLEAGVLTRFERVPALHHGFLHLLDHPPAAAVFDAMADWLAGLER